MRGSIISRRMRSGSSSATAASALNPSLAVMTRIFSRCRVNCTILRTVGLSSTTSTTGSFINSTSFGPALEPFAGQYPFDAFVDWQRAGLRDSNHRSVHSMQSAVSGRALGQRLHSHLTEAQKPALRSRAEKPPKAHETGARNGNYPLPLPKSFRKPRASTSAAPSSHPNTHVEVRRPSPAYAGYKSPGNPVALL